jgi:autotransporter-associated beta strand protein
VGALANGGSASDIGASANGAGNLVFDSGTLLYTGGAQNCDRLFSVTTGGGTLIAQNGGLNLSTAGAVSYPDTGARVFSLQANGTGASTLAASLADNGGTTSLVKNGTNTWILTGNNTESGSTTINAGTLQIGTGGATGAIGTGPIVNNASLDINRSGTLTIAGAISGTGSLTNDGSGTLILAANNSYGVTIINQGTVQVGTGGATGTISPTAAVTDNGQLVVNTSQSSSINGIISGTGSLRDSGSGVLQTIGANTYTGGTTIDAGASLQICQNNIGSTTTTAITNNGALLLSRQDTGAYIYPGPITGTGLVQMFMVNGNTGDVTLTGTNTYSGGTYILGGTLIFGDNATPGGGAIVGNVYLTNDPGHSVSGPGTFLAAGVTFNRPDSFTFPGNIVGEGIFTQEGNGTMTLTGANTWTNGTTITTGTLQIGNGGTAGTIGTTTANNARGITDNGTLVFDRSDNYPVGINLTGTGNLIQFGAGILSLTGSNSITGTTTVSNGTMVISFAGLDMNVVSGATLAPGGLGTVGTLQILGNFNMTAGTLEVTLNKTPGGQSNSVVLVTGASTVTGSSVKLLNYGSALNVGDKFFIFTNAVSGFTTVTGLGATFANGLSTDGSVTVTSVAPAPVLTNSVSGGNVNLSWSPAWTGLYLQVQTNTLAAGFGANWVTIPGTSTGHAYTTPVNTAANTCLFYRLSPTP